MGNASDCANAIHDEADAQSYRDAAIEFCGSIYSSRDRMDITREAFATMERIARKHAVKP